MLVLRNAITRPYWTSMHEYVLNRMKVCVSEKVTPKVWKLQSGLYRQVYYICDANGWPASWLYLTQRKGWKAWEVAQVWTFPEHRGKGQAETLYKAAINADGILLASGNLHTQYSQAMWRSFIRRRLFNVWAQDFKDLSHTSTVDVEDGELECGLPIYIDPGTRRPTSDVRLLALRKDHQ